MLDGGTTNHLFVEAEHGWKADGIISGIIQFGLI